ncbi:MAG: hypothetical protein ACXQTP_07070 [Candidatus Methanofastidiosia archaeon]
MPRQTKKDTSSNKTTKKIDEKRIEELETKIKELEARPKVVEKSAPRSNGTALKIIAGLLGILFVIATAGAVYFANEARINSDCETNYKGILGDYNELSSLYNTLDTEKQSLESQVSTLNTQISALSTQLEDLRSSGIAKDADIESLEMQIDELNATLQTKENRIGYLEVMMESYKTRNDDLKDQLDACKEENDGADITLHPYIGSMWASNPVTLEWEDTDGDTLIDKTVAYFYIYLCVTCTECDTCSYCDPCDPCYPCTPCTHYCCASSGATYDALRLYIKVTTDLHDESDDTDDTQSIEVVSWTWV